MKRKYNEKGGKKKFYAVARGHKIGIFDSWDECSQQVSGFKNAKFKSFNTKVEAEEFISTNKNGLSNFEEKTEKIENHTFELSQEQLEEFEKEEKEYFEKKQKLENKSSNEDLVIVYTDGSFRQKYGGGIGCWFGDRDDRNLSEKFPLKNPTNQRAELYAAMRALQVIPSDKDVEIRTDSEYTIKSMTVWVRNWERNGWQNSLGKDVENQDLIRPLLKIIRERSGKVKFTWVKGHSGDYGNECADKLALRGGEKSL